MGNSLKFRQALQDIENDKKNQFYVDIAQQYGKIIRLIFEFDASDIAASSLNSNQYLKDLIAGKLRSSGDDDRTDKLLLGSEAPYKKLASKFYSIQDQIEESGGFAKLLTTATLNVISSFLGTDVTPTIKKIEDLKPLVNIAKWDGYNSGYKFAKGLVNGMIDVLPSESFLAYCKGNGTYLGES